MLEGQTIHQLRIDTYLYNEMLAGNRDFEIRFTTRVFKVDDIVIYHETIKSKDTGNICAPRKICFVQEGHKPIDDHNLVVFQTKQIGTRIKTMGLVPSITLDMAEAIAISGQHFKLTVLHGVEIEKSIAAGFFMEGYNYAKSINE